MDLREAANPAIAESNRHPWELARFELMCFFIETYLPAVKVNPTRILDLGCGDTFFAEQLSKRFPLAEFIAVDIAFTKEIIAACYARIGSEKIKLHSHIDEVSLPANAAFDIILLLDVLEHIEEDKLFLEGLQSKSFFGQESLLFITVPAFQSLFVGRDIFLGHFRRYNNKQLKNLTAQTNLTNIRTAYFFFILLLPRMVLKLKEKFTGANPDKEKGIGAYKGGSIFTLAVVRVLMFDFLMTRLFHFLGIKLPGLSNITICKKRLS